MVTVGKSKKLFFKKLLNSLIKPYNEANSPKKIPIKLPTISLPYFIPNHLPNYKKISNVTTICIPKPEYFIHSEGFLFI